MSPESLPHIDRAHRFLAQARGAVLQAAWETVAFNAYTAAFHAAQVLVFDRSRQTPKTHNGLKSELNRLAALEPAMDADLVRRFGRAEKVRNTAVYSQDDLDPAPAKEALAWAELFVAEVERVLA